MATVSTLPQHRRRKPTTYGKQSRTAGSWNATNLDALADDELSSATTIKSPATTVKTAYPVEKPKMLPLARKATKTRGGNQDPWDIPSSEDEALPSHTRTTPPRLSGERRPVKRQEEATIKLAPWEKSKADVPQADRGGQQGQRATLAKRPVGHERPLGTAGRARTMSGDVAHALPPDTILVASRPANPSAQLKAEERKDAHERAQKRGMQAQNDGPDANARKRSRRVAPSNDMDVDVPMDEAVSIRHDRATSTMSPVPAEKDVYDLELSPGEEQASYRAVGKARKPASVLRRLNSAATSRSLLKQTRSAPGHLSGMLPADTDSSDVTTTTSPSAANSRAETPQKGVQLPSTPPRSQQALTSRDTIKANGTITPKQAQLWNRLLATDDTPSALPMQTLSLTSTKRMLPKSRSDIGRDRTKLVERMRMTMPSSDEDSDGDSGASDGATSVSSDADEVPVGPEQSMPSPPRPSQEQAQNVAPVEQGPKRTYARNRSYLRDSFDEELLLDLPSAGLARAPGPARRTGRAVTQKSAFDPEDSDDEGTSGRLRTIHELRAGGVNRRFMDDTSGLLEDMANHAMSARGRRRSAVTEIASKLQDKAFAERFLRQGFEEALVRECAAAPDDVADAALGMAMIILMSAEPSEQTLVSLKNGNVIGWFARFLVSRADVRAFGKDRKHNMSKAAQTSFADLVSAFTAQQGVWGDVKPPSITPRVLALKALDLLVGGLRRLGDRTELVDEAQLREILPLETHEVSEGPHELLLAVSALEALSTSTTLSLAWPAEVCERVGLIFGAMAHAPGRPPHGLFLMLRLLLNLTNDNTRTCRVLSTPATVALLLRIITGGFGKLHEAEGGEEWKVNLDVLVLGMGIMINLTDHDDDDSARRHAASADAAASLRALVAAFRQGQTRMVEAESVEESASNVAYGYLAVMLANLCSSVGARALVASCMPAQRLDGLVAAVQEFIVYHQKVDKMQFEGDEGMEVWSAFTEKLQSVLGRLQAEARV